MMLMQDATQTLLRRMLSRRWVELHLRAGDTMSGARDLDDDGIYLTFRRLSEHLTMLA